jgi:hypothetical protein
MTLGANELKRQVSQFASCLDAVEYARRVLGFQADARQAEVIEARAPRLMLCCSRQWGKSTTAAALVAHRVVREAGALVLCVAPTLRQSAELIRKVGAFLGKAGVPFHGGRLGCELKNGSRVVAVPGNEANVRGFSAPALIVIDEAARVPDVLYQALRPMLVVGRGDLALLSTPFGERGFFWKEWTAGGDGWTRVLGPATECERISVEVLEEERRAQTAEWFAQEYLCSFVGMENQAFRKEWLAAAVAEGIGVEALDFQLKGGTL